MITLARRGAMALVPVLLVAACSDTGTAPVSQLDQQVNLDVATYVTDMTADDMSMMNLSAGFFLGAPEASPPYGFGDLTISRQVTFYGISENEQDYFSRDTTEAIHFVFHMEGSHARSGDYGTVDVTVLRDRDMWLSNLWGEETERIWNGTGSSGKTRSRHSDENGDRTYDMSSSSVVDSVIVPAPRTWDSWPLSGTITREVHVTIVDDLGETTTTDRVVVITFNGTQFVTMTVNGEEFELDLGRWGCHRKGDRHDGHNG
ncbi:MAG: hypothetical protein IH616_21485 [Gemmatimonadales bacterium]|nr:hypothetical protein [Gemmatimonadales bacterium]